MFKILEDLVLFYLLYKLIFDLIIPAAQTTRQVKKQFADIQNKMHEQAEKFNQKQANHFSATTDSPHSKPDNDDYIEFEEIK